MAVLRSEQGRRRSPYLKAWVERLNLRGGLESNQGHAS